MKTLKDVKTFAKHLGATVEDNKDYGTHECRVTAPSDRVWADGVHEFVDCAYVPWKPDYDDLYNRMSYGHVICETPDCEWCDN